MKHVSAALIAVSIALGLSASAQAQTYGNAAGICAKDYRAFWDNMLSAGAKLSGEQLAAVNRVALRGYDACTAGDERFNAKNFFEKLSGQYGLKPEELFREMDSHSGAKK